uniref:Uncharacterized protein n=1 Tax=Paraburkholderia sprentiae WSM5005 TaxID=754502 RepID=A0A1I9YQ76_9BURK
MPSQLSPRVGLVYTLTPSTTLHAGFACYFTPAPFELVSSSAKRTSLIAAMRTGGWSCIRSACSACSR